MSRFSIVREVDRDYKKQKTHSPSRKCYYPKKNADRIEAGVVFKSLKDYPTVPDEDTTAHKRYDEEYTKGRVLLNAISVRLVVWTTLL